MFREQLIDVGAVALNVAAGPPSGPPLVLLHGVVRRWQDFLPLAVPLAARWQVLGVDFRGHGRSGRADSYRLPDYVGDTVRLVEGRPPEPAVVFGHSLGALVAVAVAAQSPKNVRALVLEDPPSPGFLRRLPETSYSAVFAAMRRLAGSRGPVREIADELGEVAVSRPGVEPPTRLRDLRDVVSLRFSARCLQDVDPPVLDPLLRADWTEGYAWEANLKAVRCPVLLLRGEEKLGGMLPRADAEAIECWVPDCTRVDFPALGHLIHGTEPEKTLRFVVGFLEALG